MRTRSVPTLLTILLTLLLALLLLAGCTMPDLPDLPSLPDISDLPSIPGLPEELRQIPDALRELELPDLSGIELPSLESLPVLQPPEGGIVFNGPTERRLAPGERLPGTDVAFTGVRDDHAVFQIAGQESPRRTGDSLDYDGAWVGISGSIYQARYRIYSIGSDGVRVAGVHQLMIPAVQPEQGPMPGGAVELRFPFLDGVQRGGDTIAGTTYGYLGRYERGAQLSGVPQEQYPYRSVGDSIEWEGTLRPGIGVRYDLRLLVYGVDSMRVGGVVTLHMP